ncbi:MULTISPECIES: Hsp20/alpha crystallin family protein [Pontibacillus]|uniref:Hsp20/alpha crystallin family protein n=1 Tax=Pontibacillus chungwhensis TaxID=265426 RepID=A0ABY8UY65_9BACI|nr:MULTISPECIES: Hsp20/alpha crystallin family protein [Pontibacillus]MCD5325334.1 Hsp20/alpha crystallin family protein [Pontibacillus sp. HN14]WIF98452.1 Hsp20/alpha crystallin family protein [Pontibacillus chungwhensis]
MDPFQNMNNWRQNMDRFFGEDFWGEFDGILKPTIPQINMYKSDNELLLLVNVPGLENLDDLDIFVDYSILEIKGIISLQSSQKQCIQEEILQGTFERKVELPYPVRGDRMQATYRNGIVVIQLHRMIQEEGKRNKIKIKSLDEK